MSPLFATLRSGPAWLLSLCGAVACASGGVSNDAGGRMLDAGHDTGVASPPVDAAPPPVDATSPRDAGRDAGERDAGPEQPMASEPLVGCDTQRTATALYPGAVLVDPPPAPAPFTCGMSTGQTAPFNASLVVTDDDTLLYAPAEYTGVVRSLDHGGSFEGPLNDRPASSDGLYAHPYVTRDPDSGRLFFTVYNSYTGTCGDLTGTNYWYSDDEGESWVQPEGGVGCDSWDWGKVITGPPATEGSRAALAESGYPNLVYFCAGGQLLAFGPRHYCYKSTDGGATFTRTGGDAIAPERLQIGWPNAGAITPDGTFYKVHASGDGVALTISDDEGESWRVGRVPDSALGYIPSVNFLASNIASDSEGNLYVVWVDDRDLLPYLAISRDGAETWSERMMIGAPEVKVATNINVSTRAPGYLAIVYYGSEDAEGNGGDGYATEDGRPYNAYLTVTEDVFADQPVFWSASINERDKPVFVGLTLSVSEYLGAPAFGPDGSIWAAYVRETQGFIGRMSPPNPSTSAAVGETAPSL